MAISEQLEKTAQKLIKRNEVGDARLYGVTVGVVLEIGENENCGKIRVEIPTREKPNNSCWVDVCHTMAGEGWGSYFLPEVGEEVLLVFIDGNINNPIMLGSAYTKKSKMPGQFVSKENYFKGFKSKGGFEFFLDDTQDEQEVKLKTKETWQACVSDKKKEVTFKDSNGENSLVINSEKGNIEIKAASRLVLKVGDSITATLDGESGQVTVKCSKIEVQSGERVNVETQKMSWECDSLSGKSSGVVNIEGNIVDIIAKITNMKRK